MAKRDHSTEAPAESVASAPGKAKVAPEVRKQATLLFEIAGLYRNAGAALKAGDDTAYNRAVGLIKQYQDLFTALAQTTSDNITAEGLAAINGM